MSGTVKIYEDNRAGDVKIVKSIRAKRISIRVHPSKGIIVTVPVFMNFESGISFYVSKRQWVLDALERQRQRTEAAERSGAAVSEIGDGTVVRTLLSEIRFVRQMTQCNLGRAGFSAVPEEDLSETGRLFLCRDIPVARKTITYPSSMPQEGTRELSAILSQILVRIIRDEARTLLPRKLDFFADRYGFRYNKMTVKHNLSNWGSCSAKGNINLNLNLMRLPEPLCDYVVLHELSHLRHPDHGQGFHALLEKLCADNMDRLGMLLDTVKRPSSDVEYFMELKAAIIRSKSALPVHHVLESEIKKYRLL